MITDNRGPTDSTKNAFGTRHPIMRADAKVGSDDNEEKYDFGYDHKIGSPKMGASTSESPTCDFYRPQHAGAAAQAGEPSTRSSTTPTPPSAQLSRPATRASLLRGATAPPIPRTIGLRGDSYPRSQTRPISRRP
eukprot:9116753-Pyramimonas_sp.AAC.1